ncbi:MULTISPECIES: nitrogen fixation protein NifZ [unclassified Salipiger]|uniref:nitrogen fixation protein NifZ n=1 Tax=unclassified Salipiger TaxID=2640570 RepID=UPI00080AA92E|nr:MULTISPECIES: nitrogen fixation protein NifZ [unclassified Salipiger]ANT58942.1 nitrogen fixation protein NifZ [Salipiger sp. CCB-MM3]NDV99377.1 nitrogen fixation protein NifZ [Salipiger sp. PrR002]NDW55863.1 nitrogen fixation protein NifZ [Salipiger sp. PrR004]
MSTDDREIEVYRDPAFEPGDKVISKKNVKNDGTMAGVEIGETVVRKGDEGYVRDIGVFLQQFYIYAVDFVGRGSIVGMRERELIAADPDASRRVDDPSALQSHIVTRTSREAAE